MIKAKKRKVTALVIILAAVMLIPFPIHLKDGGTVIYSAVLYSVTKAHEIACPPVYDERGYDVGTRVRILLWTVYDDVHFVPDTQ